MKEDSETLVEEPSARRTWFPRSVEPSPGCSAKSASFLEVLCARFWVCGSWFEVWGSRLRGILWLMPILAVWDFRPCSRGSCSRAYSFFGNRVVRLTVRCWSRCGKAAVFDIIVVGFVERRCGFYARSHTSRRPFQPTPVHRWRVLEWGFLRFPATRPRTFTPTVTRSLHWHRCFRRLAARGC